MKSKMKLQHYLFLLLMLTALLSCVSVKPYQKAWLNDEDMILSPRKVEIFEMNAETYREGASGANGGKTGGGCGCN